VAHPRRTGQTVQRLAPFAVYRARDGYVSICAYTDRLAHSLFRTMGRADLAATPGLGGRNARVQHYAELDGLIEQWTCSLPALEIVAKLQEAGVPVAEVRHPKEAVRDPGFSRARRRPMVHPRYGSVDELYAMGLPIQFSDSAAGFDQPPPVLGNTIRLSMAGCSATAWSASRSSERWARFRRSAAVALACGCVT